MSTKQNFQERFGIHVDTTEVRRRFVNRIKVSVFDNYFDVLDDENFTSEIAFILGEPFEDASDFEIYARGDYIRTLRVVEAIYRVFDLKDKSLMNALDSHITKAIKASEVDLGINWDKGVFLPKGAKYLDKQLIRDPLDWLKSKKYPTVYEPLIKSLKHFLESEKDNTKLYDVITDAYESLEALAKIVAGKDVTLDKNRELFVSKLKISPDYKGILKSYIEYAHKYRHALKKGEVRKPLLKDEVESYIYLTGVFIRLGINVLPD